MRRGHAPGRAGRRSLLNPARPRCRKTTVDQVRKDLEARFALRDGALKPHMPALLPLLEKSLTVRLPRPRAATGPLACGHPGAWI